MLISMQEDRGLALEEAMREIDLISRRIDEVRGLRDKEGLQ